MQTHLVLSNNFDLKSPCIHYLCCFYRNISGLLCEVKVMMEFGLRDVVSFYKWAVNDQAGKYEVANLSVDCLYAEVLNLNVFNVI